MRGRRVIVVMLLYPQPPKGGFKYQTKPMGRAVKIAVLIPDRGDRPQFLKNCMRMLAAQTVLPAHVEVVNFPAVIPRSSEETCIASEIQGVSTPLRSAQHDNRICDITKRYRTGYDRLRNKGFDVIALIENDDWYSPQYLETMAEMWLRFKEPQLMGTGYTIYYHLKLRAWFPINHPRRASAMNTLIKPDLFIDWPPDHEPFTDAHIWKQLPGCLFTPEKHIALGMKHGEGLCGGLTHNNRSARFVNKDPDFEWLKGVVDAESFEFYKNLYPQPPKGGLTASSQ